jgi:hypothetical protein
MCEPLTVAALATTALSKLPNSIVARTKLHPENSQRGAVRQPDSDALLGSLEVRHRVLMRLPEIFATNFRYLI